MASKSNGRPRIPAAVRYELWARAAGRCEFRGCNKLLYKDSLTQKQSNLATIAHIVAWTPSGPRGDEQRSAKLATDIGNLMLCCKKHGDMIDKKSLVDEYPEELLIEFKKEHEKRVRMLTEAAEDAQTHVLLIQAAIDQKEFSISQKAAFRAILPRYPAEEEAEVVDLSGLAVVPTSDAFFSLTATAISNAIGPWRRRLKGKVKRLSLFALAPVPLLVHLGYLLGDIQAVDLFQRHRDTQDWRWKEEERAEETLYEITVPDQEEDRGPLGLVIEISSRISEQPITEVLGEGARLYRISASHPSPDFLKSRKRLEIFGYEVRKLLEEIRERHEHGERIHVFAAVPAPVAVELGRSVKAFDPPLEIYEYIKAERRYMSALTVNERGGDRDG